MEDAIRAIKTGDINCVQDFCKLGGDCNARCADGSQCLLHFAAAAGHKHIVTHLCVQGADINSLSTTKRQTPLMLAAMAGHYDTVRYLRQAGAHTDTRDYQGMTAADLAQHANHREINQLLCPQQPPPSSVCQDL